MRQPEGFSDGTNRVCELLKAIYGTMQAPRCFNKKLSDTLLNMKTIKLSRSVQDPCVYYSNPPRRFVVLVYVDDSIIASYSEKLIDDFLKSLAEPLSLPPTNSNNFWDFELMSPEIEGGFRSTKPRTLTRCWNGST